MNNSKNSNSKNSNFKNSNNQYSKKSRIIFIIVISTISLAFIGFLIYLIISNKFHENFADAYNMKNKICTDFDKIFVNIPVGNNKKDIFKLKIFPQNTQSNKKYKSVHPSSNEYIMYIEGNTHKSKEQSNAEFLMI